MEKNKPIADISLDVLIDVCALPNKSKEEIKEEFSKMNEENVHQIFRYRKFNDNFADAVTICNSGDYIIGIVRPCYKEFLNKICNTLNLPKRDKYIDDDNLTKELHEQLKKISILPENYLDDEFFYIYKDYQRGKSYLKDLENEYKDKPEKNDEYRKREKYFYKCALSKNYNRFVHKQEDLYTRFVDRRQKYKELIETKDYNKLIKENFDINKLALFLMSQYVDFTRTCEDRNKLKLAYKIIDKYVKSRTVDKNTTIALNNRVYDYNYVIQGHAYLKDKIANMKVKVPWEIFPKGKKVESTNEEEGKTKNKMSEKELEELRKIGREKTEFFEASNYLIKIEGRETFNGYIGYIYPNGEVLLDKKYEEKYPSTAVGNATYHVKAVNFELVSWIDKTTVRNNPLVEKKNHTDTWETRINDIIEKEGTEEDKQAAKDLIDRLKKRSK